MGMLLVVECSSALLYSVVLVLPQAVVVVRRAVWVRSYSALAVRLLVAEVLDSKRFVMWSPDLSRMLPSLFRRTSSAWACLLRTVLQAGVLAPLPLLLTRH